MAVNSESSKDSQLHTVAPRSRVSGEEFPAVASHIAELLLHAVGNAARLWNRSASPEDRNKENTGRL